MKRAVTILAASLLLSLPAVAHLPQQAPHQSWAAGDLKLESGEAIKDFAISYVTHGKLNEKKSNVILMVTAISGNHHRLDFMIGPGKALDTDKYFIVCTDAIGNGLTSSPSNSKAQPRMQFPKFTIRDMVASQYRLMKEKLGIDHVVAVIGPSMGGMQVLQWGVSYPDYMDSLVAMVPLAKTPAWSVAVMESSRKAIMLDPAWKDGNYEAPPEKGIRLWRDILTFLSARTPDMYAAQFKNGLDILPWLEQQETALLKVFDANDWIYQTWAYDRHDVGTTPGFNGDTAKALGSIKAKTLVLTGTKDLLNPEFEPIAPSRRMSTSSTARHRCFSMR
jgi:homoserine O-acetyltransferase/O-succinyltransferase